MFRSQLSRRYQSRDMFAEFDRLQRNLQQAFATSPSIRGWSRGYPAMNVGITPQSVEVYCFAPGLAPDSIDVQIDKGVLSVAGERAADTVSADDDKVSLHIDERFAGKFRRVVTLPDDVDAQVVQASYRDGVLQVSIARRTATQPRRIVVQ